MVPSRISVTKTAFAQLRAKMGIITAMMTIDALRTLTGRCTTTRCGSAARGESSVSVMIESMSSLSFTERRVATRLSSPGAPPLPRGCSG